MYLQVASVEVVEGLVVDVEGLVDVEDLVDAEDLVDVEDLVDAVVGEISEVAEVEVVGEISEVAEVEVVDVDSEVISYVDHQKIMMELDESTDFIQKWKCHVLAFTNPQNYIFGIYIRNIHVKKAAFT